MKTKLYLLLTLFVTCQQTYAQCGQRYKEKVFADVTITSDIVYTTANNTTLKLDVYEPTGDTQSLRPLIIMAHGGSFVLGNKTMDSVVTRYCNSFAKRGYVCASIDYRLGSPLQLLDTVSLMNVVTKCIGDGKAAIRFFRKDAATTNTWRINPNMIIVGGNSAGAVLYMQAVYIDSVNEAPSTYRDAMIQNGGLEGNSGNDGYSSQAQALINLAGGLNVPEFVGPNSIPSFNAQGDADVTIAYNCGFAENGLVPVRLCGLGAIEPLYQQYNIPHYTKVYPGATHTPWQNNLAMMAELDTLTANFLYGIVCNNSVGITHVSDNGSIRIWPNPAGNWFTVTCTGYQLTAIQLLDVQGRLLSEKEPVGHSAVFERGSLPGGLYLVRMLQQNGEVVSRKVVLQ